MSSWQLHSTHCQPSHHHYTVHTAAVVQTHLVARQQTMLQYRPGQRRLFTRAFTTRFQVWMLNSSHRPQVRQRCFKLLCFAGPLRPLVSMVKAVFCSCYNIDVHYTWHSDCDRTVPWATGENENWRKVTPRRIQRRSGDDVMIDKNQSGSKDWSQIQLVQTKTQPGA